MFWGLSESLDLYEEYLKAFESQAADVSSEIQKDNKNVKNVEAENVENIISDSPETNSVSNSNSKPASTSVSSSNFNPNSLHSDSTSLNILLFGAGDPRHILKTIAKLYTHAIESKIDATIHPSPSSSPIINFYILDGCTEIVARNLALLAIALESPECLNLRSKVHIFMDVYGNALIRPASHHYLNAKSRTLSKMITDDEHRKHLAPFLNIEGLKYRERDGLENSFNFFQPKEDHVFDITKYWSGRVRKLLGSRYDFRDGAFDWDLNMTLKYREAKQICNQEYRYWRETGIAFTYPEYEQCKPNKTLSAGLVRNGKKYMHRGYVGDIEVGPFCAFGLKICDERFTKSAYGENDYRATDITEKNLLELFHEIKERKPYEHDVNQSQKYGAIKLQMGNRFTYNEDDSEHTQRYETPWLNIEGIDQIHFLSVDEILVLQNDTNKRWRNFFDIVFVGHNYFTLLKPKFVDVLRQNGLLILETKLLSLHRREEIIKFETNLKDYAKSVNLKNVLNYNAINANFSILKFRKDIEAN